MASSHLDLSLLPFFPPNQIFVQILESGKSASTPQNGNIFEDLFLVRYGDFRKYDQEDKLKT
jgi:hypothetical protein